MQDLVNKARGNSVTMDRINGTEKYYPDASILFTEPYHREGEVPHYTMLLTTAFPRKAGDPVVGQDSGFKTPSGKGQLVVTNQAVHYVGDQPRMLEMPYETIEAVEPKKVEDCGTISFSMSSREEQFVFANKAGNPDNVVEAIGYIREQIV